MSNAKDIVEKIDETKEVIEKSGKEVATNIDQLNTILEIYQPLVNKLMSWVGYGLILIGILLTLNVALIIYLFVKK
jgi:hypothetical protein